MYYGAKQMLNGINVNLNRQKAQVMMVRIGITIAGTVTYFEILKINSVFYIFVMKGTQKHNMVSMPDGLNA